MRGRKKKKSISDYNEPGGCVSCDEITIPAINGKKHKKRAGDQGELSTEEI